jgi:hypothetical protein
MFFARVLEGGERDGLAGDEVLHVLGWVCLLLWGEVMVEVDLLDLRLFLLHALLLLELLVRNESSHALLPPRVLMLDFLDQLLYLEVAGQPVSVIRYAAG